MGKFVDLTGMIFNRLTVIGIADRNAKGSILWDCKCSCGGTSKVLGGALKNGNTKSCGCMKAEALLARNTTHGLSKSPEYSHWKDMIKRCFNPNNKRYKDYAERGISVHQDFVEDYTKFLNEIGPKPQDGQRWSVGRKDNNGWYTYGNIRWELDKQQAQNHTKQRNNTSGIVGVMLQTKVIVGNVYESFVAAWNTLDGKKRTKNFSTNKFGHERAKELAIEYRTKMIEELKSQGAEYADSHGSEK